MDAFEFYSRNKTIRKPNEMAIYFINTKQNHWSVRFQFYAMFWGQQCKFTSIEL